jgi:hypothetical protein
VLFEAQKAELDLAARFGIASARSTAAARSRLNRRSTACFATPCHPLAVTGADAAHFDQAFRPLKDGGYPLVR